MLETAVDTSIAYIIYSSELLCKIAIIPIAQILQVRIRKGKTCLRIITGAERRANSNLSDSEKLPQKRILYFATGSKKSAHPFMKILSGVKKCRFCCGAEQVQHTRLTPLRVVITRIVRAPRKESGFVK